MSNSESQGESLDGKPNIKPLSEWSDGKLNIQIAILCPDLFEIRETHRGGSLVKYIIYEGDEDLTEINFCADLNAMNEAEKVLTIHQTREYLRHLQIITRGQLSQPTDWMQQAVVVHATARQRSEAFVATLGPESTSNHSACGSALSKKPKL